MNKYTIYCSPEQTRKALELGAPILLVPEEFYTEEKHFRMEIEGENASVILPTTQQMIGWLEEQGVIDYYINRDMYDELNYLDTYGFFVDFGKKNRLVGYGFSTRKEATLASIDKALEYLTIRRYDKNNL